MAELLTAVAVAHVAPGGGVRAQPAIVGDDQLLADLRARGVARLERLGEAEPGPHEQRLDGRDGDPERRRQVGVGHPAELAHEQRRALLIGQPAHVRDQAPERLALVGLGDRVVDRRAQQLDHLGRRRRGPAQLVDAPVVRHPVEPGAQSQLAVVGAQARSRRGRRCPGARPRRPGGAGQHLARVGEQPLAVAVVDHPERLVVAGPEQRHELLVGAQPKERRPDRRPGPSYCCRCWECGRFHVIPVLTLTGEPEEGFANRSIAAPGAAAPCQDSDTITCLTSV